MSIIILKKKKTEQNNATRKQQCINVFAFHFVVRSFYQIERGQQMTID